MPTNPSDRAPSFIHSGFSDSEHHRPLSTPEAGRPLFGNVDGVPYGILIDPLGDFLAPALTPDLVRVRHVASVQALLFAPELGWVTGRVGGDLARFVVSLDVPVDAGRDRVVVHGEALAASVVELMSLRIALVDDILRVPVVLVRPRAVGGEWPALRSVLDA